jgi:hypothetical protein
MTSDQFFRMIATTVICAAIPAIRSIISDIKERRAKRRSEGHPEP